jgi:hypothetical protein
MRIASTASFGVAAVPYQPLMIRNRPPPAIDSRIVFAVSPTARSSAVVNIENLPMPEASDRRRAADGPSRLRRPNATWGGADDARTRTTVLYSVAARDAAIA